MVDNARLGSILRDERTKKDRSISDLALALGKSRAYLSAVELGHTRASRGLLQGYESALELTPGSLTQHLDSPPSSSKSAGCTTEVVNTILTRVREIGAPVKSPPPNTPSAPPAGLDGSARSWQGRTVIRGREEVLFAANALIENAVEQADPSSEPILVAYAAPPHARAHSLKLALAKGWHVDVVYPPADRDVTGSAWPERIERILRLLSAGGGRFSAYTYEPSGTAGTGTGSYAQRWTQAMYCEILVVPNQGAMLFLPTKTRESDAARFFDEKADRETVNLLRDYVQAFVLTHATPVLKVYEHEYRAGRPPEDTVAAFVENRLRFDRSLTAAEIKEGDRFLCKAGFSTLMTPIRVDKERANRSARGDIWKVFAKALIDNREQRMAAFHAQLEDPSRDTTFVDFIGRPGIEAMVRGGPISLDDLIGEPLALQEARDFLQSVVDTLRSYENYHMVLLDSDPDVFWEVKGDHVAFLEVFQKEDQHVREIDIEINEPTVVAQFRRYALDLWGNKTPQERREDKEAVIRALKDKIRVLDEKIKPPL